MKKTGILILMCIYNISFAQNHLIDSLIQKNYYTFKTVNEKESFVGDGWDTLLKKIDETNSLLIGETHFTNEVPYFLNAIINKVKFDNYFHEIDPYSNAIIESKIKLLAPKNLDEFVRKFSSNFSFLEIDKDFKLFEKIVQSGIHTYGVEQISLFADKLIISNWSEISMNKKAKEIYQQMLKNSYNLTLKDKNKKYLFSDDCLEKINSLLKLELSKEERKQIEDLKLSREIYLNGNHHLRIQLMKNILLQEMPNLTTKKNLFKFGAFHTPKGESLMEIFDIGNLIFNIEDGNFRNSLHIMIVGRHSNESLEKLKLYQSFLKVVKNDEWYCFDLQPLQKAISTNKLKIEDPTLLRIIKGYDILIYIPKLTESKNIYYKSE